MVSQMLTKTKLIATKLDAKIRRFGPVNSITWYQLSSYVYWVRKNGSLTKSDGNRVDIWGECIEKLQYCKQTSLQWYIEYICVQQNSR